MSTRIARRALLAGASALLSMAPALAEQPARLEVWRDPNCGCCSGWVAQMRAAGFAVEDRVVPSLGPIRRMLGTPADLLSCHAARVGGYVLEGHVPALAVQRLLAERPERIRGLAVAGMPIGSPGMEVAGLPDDAYDVVAFDGGDGRRPFMRFTGGRPA